MVSLFSSQTRNSSRSVVPATFSDFQIVLSQQIQSALDQIKEKPIQLEQYEALYETQIMQQLLLAEGDSIEALAENEEVLTKFGRNKKLCQPVSLFDGQLPPLLVELVTNAVLNQNSVRQSGVETDDLHREFLSDFFRALPSVENLFSKYSKLQTQFSKKYSKLKGLFRQILLSFPDMDPGFDMHVEEDFLDNLVPTYRADPEITHYLQMLLQNFVTNCWLLHHSIKSDSDVPEAEKRLQEYFKLLHCFLGLCEKLGNKNESTLARHSYLSYFETLISGKFSSEKLQAFSVVDCLQAIPATTPEEVLGRNAFVLKLMQGVLRSSDRSEEEKMTALSSLETCIMPVKTSFLNRLLLTIKDTIKSFMIVFGAKQQQSSYKLANGVHNQVHRLFTDYKLAERPSECLKFVESTTGPSAACG